ncbi:MAG: UDP-N-acetylglucosamine 2-epimerase (non-hydrolyzing) [Bacteroidota bacterium]
MKKIFVVFGTRPEIIKMAPVIHELKKTAFEISVIHSGQHSDMADPMIRLFDIQVDFNLNIMRHGQDLFDLTTSLIPKLKELFIAQQPDLVLVHGDTTTALLTAQTAFYLNIPVHHVEAGLRSFDRYNPFPEEINRVQIDVLSSVLYAPNEVHKQQLLQSGRTDEEVVVTGNTVIDALQYIQNLEAFSERRPTMLQEIDPDQRLIVLTTHRRENHGEPMQRIFEAVDEFLAEHWNTLVVYPSHQNPAVKASWEKAKVRSSRFKRLSPQDYLSFLHLMKRADLILTDSGGIQEEASALGKPLLVLRETTERPEVIEAGLGELVGSDKDRIKERAGHYLNTRWEEKPFSFYGDGNAAKNIRAYLETQL